MRNGRRRAAGTIVPLIAAAALTVSATSAGAATGNTRGFTAKPLSVASVIDGAKSTTGKLAQSDAALLKRTDSKLVNVVVKLDYDASASYTGNIRGLAATSPRVTGKKLTGKSSAEVAYSKYTKSIDAKFRSAVGSKIKGAKLGRSLSTVYGGVALRVPANEAKNLLALPDVAAVQSDTLRQPQVVEGPQFIGAPTIWKQEGGQALAGKGVIFGDIDSGLWPENPMVADNPALGTPPAAPSGQPRECNYGDNPLTLATDVFQCNHKVIGGVNELETYNAQVGGEVYPDTARDSNGHGTHTTTTAAGDNVKHAPIFGVDRGPISGVAPGAWVIEYKVCGVEGCFGSDSAAAVAQAILDGVNVINFSISGGSTPFTDPVELAFLDAYDAGVTVAASAGNSGPGAATTDHHSPWVITVAASTQTRAFESTLTLADGAATQTLVGSSLTAGVTTPTPIVLAQNVPGYTGGQFCGAEFAPGSLAGKVVACARGGTNADGAIGRVQKGFYASHGGAAGMILYNPTLADTETDNHFLPTVHLADGTQFLAFMAAHPNATASFTAGVKATAQGDVMASFSSRGPGGLFLKPDITAPGVQVLAGNTPTPDEVAGGPAGQNFQAIAGTSMSSPHIAGSAILLKALHPSWGPGAIKSALMTTAKTNVVKEDETTPADPFDDGSGRVDLTKAGKAGLVFEDSAANMASMGNDPLLAPEVNIASINLPTMPGSVTVLRTARNVSGKAYGFSTGTTAPAGSSIKITPSHGTIPKNGSQTFQITVTSSGTGQQFGQVRLFSNGSPTLHLPVAWFNQQGDVTFTQSCTPASIAVGASTACTVSATNLSLSPAAVAATSTVSNGLRITSATGASVSSSHKKATAGPSVLEGAKDAIPSIAAGDSPAGYLPLSAFGATPTAVSDEQNLNFNVPGFKFGGQTYSRIGVDSNGYISIGGADGSADISFTPQTLPDPSKPNGLLAAYWTDLGPGNVYATTLTDGVDTWIVVEWQTHVFGDTGATGARTFETWIQTGDTEGISYAYDPSAQRDAPSGAGLTVGAENLTGTAGDQITGFPTGDLVVTTTPGAPGGSLSYTLNIKGNARGAQSLSSSMQSNLTLGSTNVTTPITVTP